MRAWRIAVFASLVAAIGGAACTTSSNSLPYTPYTGVNLTTGAGLTGLECGTGEAQVSWYAVVLGDANDAAAPDLATLSDGGPPVWASVFSCSTDGVFTNITTSPDGSPSIEAWIYAYDEADFVAAAQTVPGFACTQGTCPLSVTDVRALVQAPATYVTTCLASPESGDNVLASCMAPRATRALSSDAGADAASADSAGDGPSSTVSPDGATDDSPDGADSE